MRPLRVDRRVRRRRDPRKPHRARERRLVSQAGGHGGWTL